MRTPNPGWYVWVKVGGTDDVMDLMGTGNGRRKVGSADYRPDPASLTAPHQASSHLGSSILWRVRCIFLIEPVLFSMISGVLNRTAGEKGSKSFPDCKGKAKMAFADGMTFLHRNS